jgi:hypothetical protein
MFFKFGEKERRKAWRQRAAVIANLIDRTAGLGTLGEDERYVLQRIVAELLPIADGADRKDFKARLKAIQKEIGKQRDRLRDLVGTVEQIEQDCDEAIDDMDRAADALSRLQ